MTLYPFRPFNSGISFQTAVRVEVTFSEFNISTRVPFNVDEGPDQYSAGWAGSKVQSGLYPHL